MIISFLYFLRFRHEKELYIIHYLKDFLRIRNWSKLLTDDLDYERIFFYWDEIYDRCEHCGIALNLINPTARDIIEFLSKQPIDKQSVIKNDNHLHSILAEICERDSSFITKEIFDIYLKEFMMQDCSVFYYPRLFNFLDKKEKTYMILNHHKKIPRYMNLDLDIDLKTILNLKKGT